MPRTIKHYKPYGDKSEFERNFAWLITSSIGQRVGFLAGMLIVVALYAISIFLPEFGLLPFLFAYMVVFISFSWFVFKSKTTYKVFHKYSNTPGDGREVTLAKYRFSDEAVAPFRGLIHGTVSLAFPMLAWSGMIFQANDAYFGDIYTEHPNMFLSEAAYLSSLFWWPVLVVTWIACIIVFWDRENPA
jgi:hypothetical protein